MSSEDRRENRPQEPGRLVRPYYMTGGRARPTQDDLEIEALVSTTAMGERSPKLTVEQRAIIALCRDLLSVAEVSARLDLPLGVTRVLIGDMASEGMVILHRPTSVGDRPDLALLQRVLYGLQERL
jgi:Protein of unknown function (DUF742)